MGIALRCGNASMHGDKAIPNSPILVRTTSVSRQVSMCVLAFAAVLFPPMICLSADLSSQPADAEIRKLVEQLSDDTADVRRTAKEKLIAYGAHVVPHLEKALLSATNVEEARGPITVLGALALDADPKTASLAYDALSRQRGANSPEVSALVKTALRTSSQRFSPIETALIAELRRSGVRLALDRYGRPWHATLHGNELNDMHVMKLIDLPTIQYIKIDGAKTTDRSLATLRGLPVLRSISIKRTKITPAAVHELKASRPHLDITFSPLSDEHLPADTDHALAMVRRLNAPYELDKSRKHVRRLNLSGQTLTEEDLNVLTGLHHLEFLTLDNSNVEDEWLTHVSRFPMLKALGLQETSITNAGVEQLKVLPQLQYLTLTGTRITDDAMNAVSKIVTLHELQVGQTSISRNGIEMLRGLPYLVLIDAKDTKVTSEDVISSKSRFKQNVHIVIR